MIELILELSEILKHNPLMKEIYLSKIFPKAYSNQFLFTEMEKFSKIQVYSK